MKNPRGYADLARQNATAAKAAATNQYNGFFLFNGTGVMSARLWQPQFFDCFACTAQAGGLAESTLLEIHIIDFHSRF